MSADQQLDKGLRRRGWFVVAAFVAMAIYVVVSHHNPGAAFIGCPFRWATGFSCFGCGMTRGTGHVFHGNLVEALRFHPFAIPFVIGFAVSAAHYLIQNLAGRELDYAALRFWRRISRPVWVCAAILVLGFGFVRFGLEVSGFLTPI